MMIFRLVSPRLRCENRVQMHSLQRRPLLTLVFVTLLVLGPRASAQDGNVQLDSESTRIDRILRQMSDFLTSAQSFGFTAHEVMDEMEEGRRIQYSNSRSVVVRRPNHVATEAFGDLVNRSVWYDGQVPAPDSIDAVLDEIEERLGIVVPLSEMLSENVYRVLTQQIRRASYLGLHQVRGIECHHLIFTQDDLDWQLWVEASSTPVPRKIVIVYKQEPGIPQYAAVFSEWNFTVSTPDELFEFHPPEGARKLDMGVPLAP